MDIESKAVFLSKSDQFAHLDGRRVEEFSLRECANFLQANGGLLFDVIHAVAGKKEKEIISETIATSILLNSRTQKCSSVQKLLSLILDSCGCSKDVQFSFDYCYCVSMNGDNSFSRALPE